MSTGRDNMRKTIIWLSLFLLLAGGLRIAFNVEASWDETTERYLYSGNDPYYHDRVTRHIVDNGNHLNFDPAINYPDGAFNPNPPLFDWTTAPLALVLDAAGSPDGVGLALNLMVAIWGALTVIPAYMLGRDLWGRSTGLWAAFFMAISAPHIQRSVFGFADHDAPTMFFIALAFAFLVKALKHLDHREYVADWRHSGAMKEGFSAAIKHNKTALIWSTLCGVSLSLTALTWKGYPYALAVMAIAIGFQLIQDHLKNRDSTAIFLVYLIPLVMVILLPYLLYYIHVPDFLDTTIVPSLYVLLGVLIAGAILVPTRDLPSILVFPALLLAGGIGLLLLLVVFPSAGETIFTGLGYFKQTKLYTTISEAQRAELGRVAASFGFFTFVLAFWGFGNTIKHAWKGKVEHMAMAAWAAVALFMAFAASRFIMNAAPVFAVLIGFGVARLGTMIGWEEVRRRFRKKHGQNVIASGATSMTWKHTAGTVMIAVFLVLPSVWVGVDAATSFEFEDKHDLDPKNKYLGAFGLQFSLDDSGWLDLFHYLSQQDTDVPIEDRPAFIAWWDYGHWATDVGLHPTVADPFQNHFGMAGRFLASESENEATAWLLLLLLNDDAKKNGGQFTPAVRDIMAGYHVSLANIPNMKTMDERYDALNQTDLLFRADDLYDVYHRVSDATGKDIRYFGADSRMWPLGQSGIFYAPVYLANKNPDDFIETRWRTEDPSVTLRQICYGVDAKGNSYELDTCRYESDAGQVYEIISGRAFPEGTSPTVDAQGQVEGGLGLAGNQPDVLPTASFRNSMYAKAFGNIQSDIRSPGDGLHHWRAVFEDTTDLSDQGFDFDRRNTVLLEYFRGATIQGTVTDDTGAPLDNREVTIRDGFGATHQRVHTDADGAFELTAPFAVNGDLTLEVRRSGQLVATYNGTDIQVTRDQAATGAVITGMSVEVPRGALTGIIFDDRDEDGVYNSSIDVALSGATVQFERHNTTTGVDGRYTLTNLPAGPDALVARATGYENATLGVQVEPGATKEQDLGLTATPSDVTITVTDGNNPVEFRRFQVTGDAGDQTHTTGTNGTTTVSLAPGTYTFNINDTFVDENGVEVSYTGTQTFTVPFGGSAVEREFVVSRQ